MQKVSIIKNIRSCCQTEFAKAAKAHIGVAVYIKLTLLCLPNLLCYSIRHFSLSIYNLDVCRVNVLSFHEMNMAGCR